MSRQRPDRVGLPGQPRPRGFPPCRECTAPDSGGRCRGPVPLPSAVEGINKQGRRRRRRPAPIAVGAVKRAVGGFAGQTVPGEKAAPDERRQEGRAHGMWQAIAQQQRQQQEQRLPAGHDAAIRLQTGGKAAARPQPAEGGTQAIGAGGGGGGGRCLPPGGMEGGDLVKLKDGQVARWGKPAARLRQSSGVSSRHRCRGDGRGLRRQPVSRLRHQPAQHLPHPGGGVERRSGGPQTERYGSTPQALVKAQSA